MGNPCCFGLNILIAELEEGSPSVGPIVGGQMVP